MDPASRFAACSHHARFLQYSPYPAVILSHIHPPLAAHLTFAVCDRRGVMGSARTKSVVM
jgi:hypothetical protein